MATSFTYPYNIANSDKYKEILTYLNDKIDSVKKQVSYFDFYNITNAVIDTNHFAAQINSLPFNEALVVNTPPFYYNGENYATGDIIIKNNTGGIHHIKAQTGGVYYPSKIKLDNTGDYSFEYSYAGSMPTVPNSNVPLSEQSDGSWVGESSFAEKITFSGLKASDAADSNVYGEYSSLGVGGTYSFPIQYDKDNHDILPYIQFFFCYENIPQEQILIDYTLTKEDGVDADGNTVRFWKVTPSLDSSINFSSVYIKVK